MVTRVFYIVAHPQDRPYLASHEKPKYIFTHILSRDFSYGDSLNIYTHIYRTIPSVVL